MGKWICFSMSDFKFKAMVLGFSSKVLELLDLWDLVIDLWDIVKDNQPFSEQFEVFSVTFST